MGNADDMDQPVTKREMRDMFANFLEAIFTRIDKRFEAIDKRFEAIDKRFIDFGTEMKVWFSQELVSHVGTVYERHREELTVIDDKYKDLPERVTKIETKVFAPKRQRRR